MTTHYDVIVIGGEVVLIERSKRALPREPEPLGEDVALLSDGERLTGAHALGAEAGEWLQQATLAIRARLPLDVLRDTIQPNPMFSELYLAALTALDREIAVAQCVAGVAS